MLFMGKNKSWHNIYEKINELGEGGNATVYRVKSKADNEYYALKELTVGGPEKRGRFIDEINIIKENYTQIDGIIPILDCSLEEYWYTMPIAKPVLEYLDEDKIEIEKIIEHAIQLCETLEYLHEQGISHRDIKPSNIYFYEQRFYFGDFGLVEFLDNPNNFTKSDKGLGAVFTISPEMKRNPKEADGKKADVFSLAKTLWMFLTKDEKGFDGVYDYLDTNHSLRHIAKYKKIHSVELDELLKDSTDNSPDRRPAIEEFKKRLQNWLDIYSDMDKSQASDWNFLNKQLFGLNPPDSSSWRNIHKIIEVLNTVGNTPAYNHMLFHTGGGLDFSRAEIASEDNCIKLYDEIGFCHVVKPKILYFEGFDVNYKWNYFLLELDELIPIIEDGLIQDSEYLIEDIPSHYVSARYAQYGVYDYEKGTKLPEGYQTVYRYIRGKILIVMKRGPYNRISGTYDGRHGACSADKFREYIDSLIKNYTKIYKVAKQDNKFKNLSDEKLEDRILKLELFNKNLFKNEKYDNDEVLEMNKWFESQKESENYISNTFVNWDFSHIVNKYEQIESYNIKFIFKFKNPNSDFLSFESLIGIDNYICMDGKIRKLNSPNEEQCYCVYDRKIAIKMKDKFEEEVTELLKKNQLLELDDSSFSIKLIRVGKPTHLFTREEIEKEMRDADDRFSNQLIIDEAGHAKVIKNENFGYLFPVRHESWDAGNNYVGKYSALSTLDDNYISSLQGWLLYLETDNMQSMDYIHKNTNEEELLKEIKKYY